MLRNAFSQWLDKKVPQDIYDRMEFLSQENNTFGYDAWGMNTEWSRRALMMTSWLYKHYFRVTTQGIENIPQGRVMLISNHSSQMGYDGMVIWTSLFLELNPPRAVKAMIEYFFMTQPLYSQLMPRLGQVTGFPENCVSLLENEEAVLIFPEGERGGGKLIFHRYRMERFGQGFMRIAMETHTPIVPIAFIGGEEMVPSVSRMMPLAKALGLPYLPLSPSLIFPLPVKCSIYYGKPRLFTGDPFDPDVITTHIQVLKHDIELLMWEGLSKRDSVFGN